MIDLHEDILEVFVEAQRYDTFRPSDPFGRAGVAIIQGQHRARKTTRTHVGRCTSCGRRGPFTGPYSEMCATLEG